MTFRTNTNPILKIVRNGDLFLSDLVPVIPVNLLGDFSYMEFNVYRERYYRQMQAYTQLVSQRNHTTKPRIGWNKSPYTLVSHSGTVMFLPVRWHQNENLDVNLLIDSLQTVLSKEGNHLMEGDKGLVFPLFSMSSSPRVKTLILQFILGALRRFPDMSFEIYE